MRARCSVLVVMMTLALTATAHATDRPAAGVYSGQAHLGGAATHLVHIHVFADRHHASLRLGGIVITHSAPLTLNSGHWTISVHDTDFRARATWATTTHVLGVISRTSDPRADPVTTFAADLQA